MKKFLLALILFAPCIAQSDEGDLSCESFVIAHVSSTNVLSFRFLMVCEEDPGAGKNYKEILRRDTDNLSESDLVSLVEEYKAFSFKHTNVKGKEVSVEPFNLSKSLGKYTYHLSEDAKSFDPRIRNVMRLIYNPDPVVYFNAPGRHSSCSGKSTLDFGYSYENIYSATPGGISKKECEDAVNSFFADPNNSEIVDCVGGTPDGGGDRNGVECSTNCDTGSGWYNPGTKKVTICANIIHSTSSIPSVLKHELTHKKQDEKGELDRRSTDTDFTFCGKMFLAELEAYHHGSGIGIDRRSLCSLAALSVIHDCPSGYLDELKLWCYDCIDNPTGSIWCRLFWPPKDPCDEKR